MTSPRLLLACAITCIATSARADDLDLPLPSKLTLARALEILHTRGIDLLIAEAAIQSAQGDVAAADAIPNPALSVNYGPYAFYYSCTNQLGCTRPPSSYSVELSDQAAIEDTLSGKRTLRVDVAGAALRAARLGRTDAERTLAFQLKAQFEQVLLAQAALKFARDTADPPGSHLEWSGQINELKEATGRLLLIIPITLLLIAFLKYSAVRNVIDTVIVLINIPLACAGGLLALVVTGEPFSVSAAMGFISIFGIAIQGSILVVTYAQRQWAEGKSLAEGARNAAEQRFRPVLMTTLVATLGLLPAALSHGIGSQTQKPLAIVVIGGSLMLAILTQVLQPPLLVVAHGRFKLKQIITPS